MNLRLLELRHLRYFLAAAETAHFTRAAKKMHVTQPTLSHQIRQMEDQLGVRLFERKGRKVRLAAAGELLLPRARRIFSELEEAQSELAELSCSKRGNLKVGIMHTISTCAIPEIVERFIQAHPGIQLECEEMPVEGIEAALADGRLDLAISFLPAGNKNVEGEELYREELVAVLPRSHRLAARRRLKLSELRAERFVALGRGYCVRQMIDGTFEAAGVAPKVAVELSSIESILDTVEHGRVVSVLPALALCKNGRGVVGVRLAPAPRRTIGLLWRRGRERRAIAQAFASAASAALAERGSAHFLARAEAEQSSAAAKRERKSGPRSARPSEL